MRFSPPFTGNRELDSFLNDLAVYVSTLENGVQETGTVGDGDTIAIDYKHRYLHVKYANDKNGSGFSNSPTNKLYFGLLNSTSSVESTLYYKYTWYPATFGLTNLLFYKNLGGRGVQLQVTTASPDSTYFADPGTAIDLDFVTAEVADGSITTIKIADGAVTLEKLDTTGTPSATTFLDGDMHWQEHIGVADIHQIAEVDGLQEALDAKDTALAAHISAPDPHPQYTTFSNPMVALPLAPTYRGGSAEVANVAASEGTVPFAAGYAMQGGTIGIGSTVDEYASYWAAGELVGATVSYGFFSSIAAAAGYNFYAFGLAPNYFGGPTSFNSTISVYQIIYGAASTAAEASLRLPHGVAPTSPVDGDVWTTTAGIYARINGVTIGPLGTGGGGSSNSYFPGGWS